MAKSESTCDPCFRGDTESERFSFCSDCEEFLCLNCDKAHRVGKLTLNHHMTEIQQLPKVPDETIKNLKLCEKHPEKFIELYCYFHDILCCKTCMVEEHRTCDKLDVIDDISGNIKSSALVEDISKAILSLLQTYEIVIENRAQVKDFISQGETKAKESIAKLKVDLIEHVEVLEKSLLSEMKKQQKETLSTLETETNEAIHSQKNMQMMKQEFEFTLKYGSNKKLFILSEKLKHILSIEENRIQNVLSEMANLYLEYTEQANIADTISSLASLQLKRTTCGIEHVYCLNKAAQFVHAMLSFNPVKDFTISTSSPVAISGIEITENDRLLLCNYYERSILIYEEDGTFIKKRKLEGRPYKICLTSCKSLAAVTMPESKAIIFVDTESLKTIRQVQTKNAYYAIQDIGGTLIAGGHAVLDMISMDGKVNRSISVTGNSVVRYVTKGPNDTILYTDSFQLFCIKLIDETQVFKNENFGEARGIAVDKNGYIYIADKLKKEIHRLCHDGSPKDIVMHNGSPLAVRFNRDFSRFYVGLDMETRLAVFRCK